jgi:hypothetical protein
MLQSLSATYAEGTRQGRGEVLERALEFLREGK